MIEWISIDVKPPEQKPYLVEYKEFFGVEYITGYKIISWDNEFKLQPRQVVTRYSEVPAYIACKGLL